MKLLAVVSAFAASVLAGSETLDHAPNHGALDTPFSGGAVSIRDGRLGFFGDEERGIVFDIEEEARPPRDSVRITIGDVEDEEGTDIYIALDGDAEDGTRGLVISDSPNEGALFKVGEINEDGYADIEWVGGGQWLVQNTNDEDYELFWWDGESFSVAITYPVGLVAWRADE
ncbi:unnamed protein product [Parascedosporium putredinis]|uniref:Uncharacterized protein n=1 Tax=Parascedosporium putredinis TaxID=1442378 RepID=A0A9P1H5F0_9PEZI|nr:unnamed protein product [Parascedosporium putredinis]CAI7997873.1 unnamed protein product [Parascedosporium putredinis]